MSPQETTRTSHTYDELLDLAERESQAMLGVSWTQAGQMLDGGELDGTVAEAELRTLRFMLAN